MIWTARLLGGFYMIAWIIVLRQVAMNRVLDAALAALAGERTTAADRMQQRLLFTGACLTLASGLALLTLSRFAIPLFVLNSLFQGGYLLWARRSMPTQSTEGARGRRATVNAFLLFLAATLFVLAMRDKLATPWRVPAGFLPDLLSPGPVHGLAEFGVIAGITAIIALRYIMLSRLDATPRDVASDGA
jgi:hypothetical protein